MAAFVVLGMPSITGVPAQVDDTDTNSSSSRLPRYLCNARKLCRNMGARTVLWKPVPKPGLGQYLPPFAFLQESYHCTSHPGLCPLRL